MTEVAGDWGYYLDCPICNEPIVLHSNHGNCYEQCPFCGKYIGLEGKKVKVLEREDLGNDKRTNGKSK